MGSDRFLQIACMRPQGPGLTLTGTASIRLAAGILVVVCVTEPAPPRGFSSSQLASLTAIVCLGRSFDHLGHE
jgi:hypothetical protein